jgi:hypothetical protein
MQRRIVLASHTACSIVKLRVGPIGALLHIIGAY